MGFGLVEKLIVPQDIIAGLLRQLASCMLQGQCGVSIIKNEDVLSGIVEKILA